jgi:hypothetical protein
VTFRSRLRKALGLRPGRLSTYTVVGLVDLDGRTPKLVVAGIVEGDVVTIDEELAGNGRGRRFCHQVRAHSPSAAEAEARAYVSYIHSLLIHPV